MSFTVTRSRKHHVSMGNYEWTEFGAEVTLSSEDYEEGTTPEELGAAADEAVEGLLHEDIVLAFDQTDEPDKTFIALHPANTARRRSRKKN